MKQETNDGSGRTTTDKGGRPAKVNEKFLEAFRSLIFAQNKKGETFVKAFILLEDVELVEFINGAMEDPRDRVSYRTFWDWKRSARRFGQGIDPDEPDKTLEDDVTFARFYEVYRLALIGYKMKLLEGIAENYDPSWRGKAWILERKFKEWNIWDESTDEEDKKIIKRFVFKTPSTVWQISS